MALTFVILHRFVGKCWSDTQATVYIKQWKCRQYPEAHHAAQRLQDASRCLSSTVRRGTGPGGWHSWVWGGP
jgi:hypothetical protein